MKLLRDIMRVVMIAMISVGVGVLVICAFDLTGVLRLFDEFAGTMVGLGGAAIASSLSGIAILRLWPANLRRSTVYVASNRPSPRLAKEIARQMGKIDDR